MVDRSDARLILLAADLTRGVALGLVGCWLVVADRLPSIWIIMGLAAFLSTAAIAFFAAAQRVISSVVHPDELERANGYLQSGINTGEQFIGPALGSAFAFGGRVPIIGDALSFVVSAAVLRELPSVPPVNTSHTRLRSDVLDGWRQFRNSPSMTSLTATTAGIAFLTAFVASTEVVVVRDTLKLDAYWFGPFTAILAAGGIVGALIADRVIKYSRALTLPLTGLVTALSFIACAGSRSVVTVFVALTVQNTAVNIANVSIASIRQRVVSDSRRGAVIALSRSLIYGFQIPGALVGGWIAESSGTDAMFGVAALGSLAISLFVARPLRRLLAPYQAGAQPLEAAEPI